MQQLQPRVLQHHHLSQRHLFTRDHLPQDQTRESNRASQESPPRYTLHRRGRGAAAPPPEHAWEAPLSPDRRRRGATVAASAPRSESRFFAAAAAAAAASADAGQSENRREERRIQVVSNQQQQLVAAAASSFRPSTRASLSSPAAVLAAAGGPREAEARVSALVSLRAAAEAELARDPPRWLRHSVEERRRREALEVAAAEAGRELSALRLALRRGGVAR
jgi:hypothetical protein